MAQNNFIYQFANEGDARRDAVLRPYFTAGMYIPLIVYDIRFAKQVSFSPSLSGPATGYFHGFWAAIIDTTATPPTALLNHPNLKFALDRTVAPTGASLIKNNLPITLLPFLHILQNPVWVYIQEGIAYRFSPLSGGPLMFELPLDQSLLTNIPAVMPFGTISLAAGGTYQIDVVLRWSQLSVANGGLQAGLSLSAPYNLTGKVEGFSPLTNGTMVPFRGKTAGTERMTYWVDVGAVATTVSLLAAQADLNASPTVLGADSLIIETLLLPG